MTPMSPRRHGARPRPPRISVVMPVYNAERPLAECLAALHAAVPRLRDVLVDDGSTDGSRDDRGGLPGAASSRRRPGRPGGARNLGRPRRPATISSSSTPT